MLIIVPSLCFFEKWFFKCAQILISVHNFLNLKDIFFRIFWFRFKFFRLWKHSRNLSEHLHEYYHSTTLNKCPLATYMIHGEHIQQNEAEFLIPRITECEFSFKSKLSFRKNVIKKILCCIICWGLLFPWLLNHLVMDTDDVLSNLWYCDPNQLLFRPVCVFLFHS